jgi:hypothetical protein
MSDYLTFFEALQNSRKFCRGLRNAIEQLLGSGKLEGVSLSEDGCTVTISKSNAEGTLTFLFRPLTVNGRCESFLEISSPLGVRNGAYSAAGYDRDECIHDYDPSPEAPYGGFKKAIDQLIKVADFLDGDLSAYPDDEQPIVEQSDVEQSDVEQPDVEQPDVEQSDVEQSDVEQSDVEQPVVMQPVVGQPDE